MKLIGYALGASLLMTAAAHAGTVYNTTLAPIPGTTTDANGTRTTNAGAQESAPPVLNTWEQANVGGGATVGITTNYAQSGNGSAYLATTSSSSQADLVDYITAYTSPVALSTLTNASFDFYRSSSSTVDANLAPVMRLDMKIDGNYAGSLVFENVYQNQTASPTDTWTTLSADLTHGIFWATNSALGPTQAAANGGQKTLQQWIDANAGHTLGVYGIEVGVGSGWTGSFSGAVDNVTADFSNGPQVSANFEVATAAVSAAPEPGAWVLMLGGVGMLGAMMRIVKARRDEDAVAEIATA